MLHLKLFQFGKNKQAAFLELEQEYEKRLQPYIALETVALKASTSDVRKSVQEEEAVLLLPKLREDHFTIALDERGKELSSTEFAELLRKIRDEEGGKLQILIGGAHGLAPEVLARADLRLSFSKMTFTHEMIRLFLKEQLYRACMILAGKSYHK